MTKDPKRKYMGDLRWLGSLKVIGSVTIRYSAYDFLFAFRRNYASILYRFRDNQSFVESCKCFLPDARSLLEVTHSNFTKVLDIRKLWSPCDIVRRWWIIHSDRPITPAYDRQTDRHTDVGARAYTALEKITKAMVSLSLLWLQCLHCITKEPLKHLCPFSKSQKFLCRDFCWTSVTKVTCASQQGM